MPRKPKRTLKPTTLAALNRYVEHYGMAPAARNIGTSTSTLYRALQPGQGLSDTVANTIESYLAGDFTQAPSNGSFMKLDLRIDLTAADVSRLLQVCSAHGKAPDAYLAHLALMSLRDGVEYE